MTLSYNQWRVKYLALKEAIAALPNAELGLDNIEDFDVLSDEDDRPNGGDVWDFISEDETDIYSSDNGGTQGDDELGADDVLLWLSEKCAVLAMKKGLPADVFQNQLMMILQSGSPEAELQSSLADLVGFDDFEFIVNLLARKDEIVAAHTVAVSLSQGSERKLLSKAQREEALRQRDREHKSQPLSAAQSRGQQYPHVYKSHQTGNVLTPSGKRYALPEGHERHESDKFEEYTIPAARKGVLGPGQKLVQISDLDGLCRNTFKGYKTLNRMQSLVYPVAYKTSENMLICAPTGAVSGCSISFSTPSSAMEGC